MTEFLTEKRRQNTFNQRMLNHWFADDYELYAKYYAVSQNGNVMLANLKRANSNYYDMLEEIARQEENRK